MNSRYDKLTPSGISTLLEGDADEEAIIVQVLQINQTKNGKLLINISDGNFLIKAYLNDDSVIKQGKDQLSIICIKSHAALKSSVGITKLSLVTKYTQKLGTPIDWASGKQNANLPQFQKQYKIEKKIKTEHKPVKNQPEVKKQMPTATKATPGKTQQYESIDNLYIGLSRWTILCRINRKVFKVSEKKGTNILQIQLVDKSKKRIIGTFFNQAAVDFNDYLKQGSIYQISKGRLVEGNYNNSKNDKISPYNIMFDEKSQFNEVSDVNIIAKAEDTAITLWDLYERRIFNQQFDVVAYVVEVKEEKTFQREQKTTRVRQIVVADPDAQITMSVNLWRWPLPVDESLVGKVVILNRFVLKQNKDSLNLNNSRAACIITQHGHAMKMHEDKKIDTTNFKAMTQQWQKSEQNPSDFCKNTLELSQKISRMGHDQTIKSLLFVWINRFAFGKKWNYQACPKCRKVAEKYSKCNHCGFAIEQTNLSFTMGVQLSDFYGSIWITAYDDLAKKIFQDMGNTAAHQLQQLQKDDLAQKLENYAYQPYRLKILTNKDEEGRVRHRSVRMFDLHEQKVAKENLEKIHELMGYKN